MTDKEVQDDLSKHSGCAIQVSDPIWEEHVRLLDEVTTLKATICDLKGQLQDREDANSQLQLKQNNDKKAKFEQS